jgi:hypothetical protein
VTVYVARIGEPYPIRFASADGSTLRLTGFGAASTIAKPPPDQILILPAPIGR